ncbi:hypothetical protein Syun_011281 [Stephania yunnanensis]|uniref:Uncharacterized protein n=1 Tax=Stephania yunnanensis TaxID=152371 RepID=A0AAP0PIC7_9MAGN
MGGTMKGMKFGGTSWREKQFSVDLLKSGAIRVTEFSSKQSYVVLVDSRVVQWMAILILPASSSCDLAIHFLDRGPRLSPDVGRCCLIGSTGSVYGLTGTVLSVSVTGACPNPGGG